MGDIVPRKTLVKHGSQGIGGVIGGAVILGLGSLGVAGSLIIGGIVAVVGFALSRSKDDRTAGLIAAAAGIITAATAIPFVGGIAATLLTISGIGLLVAGGLSLIKFIRGYRKRAQ